MSLTVYGYSDDLIEVDGDISTEFTCPSDNGIDQGYLAFSDGTMLRISYDDPGVWRIGVITRGSGTDIVLTPTTEHDPNVYSDVCVLHGDFAWVVLGTEAAHVVRK